MGESGVRQEATPGIPQASEERADSGPSEDREEVQARLSVLARLRR